ncbi:MAG: ABC transporter permease [Magnetospiraceae bacterium]
MWRSIFIVFGKEMLDNSRDRRTLMMAMIYPLLGPCLLGAMILFISGTVQIQSAGVTTWRVSGLAHAPTSLVQYLEDEKDIKLQEITGDPNELVRTGRFDAIILFPDQFATKLESQESIRIDIVIDNSRLAGLMAFGRATATLRAYGKEVADERMRALGVDPSLPYPISTAPINVAAQENKLVDFFLYMVPPFIIFTIFMGGFYLAVDTTSGERERGSMETLMINPVPRWGLMAGKYLATLVYTLAAVGVQLCAFELIFTLISLRGGEFQRTLGLSAMAGLFFTAAPLAALAVALQVIIASITRTYKEAQTWLGLLPLIPAAPALVLIFLTTVIHPWMMGIPVYAQTLLFGQLVRGEQTQLSDFFLASATTTAVALILVSVAARLYRREAIVFTQ